MAISDTISSMRTNLQNAYSSLESKGAEIPENKNIENLSATIDGIQTGGGSGRYNVESWIKLATNTQELVITEPTGMMRNGGTIIIPPIDPPIITPPTVDTLITELDVTKPIHKVTALGVDIPLEPEPQPLDPVRVYKATRPSEWLNMHGTGTGENYDEMVEYFETHDNEIRLLFHLSNTKTNLLAFNCLISSAGGYNVSYTKLNGEVVSNDYTNQQIVELSLDYNDFGNEMTDGTRQVLIIIKPTNEGNYIRAFSKTAHSLKSSPAAFSNWQIVEFMGKATQIEDVRMGSSSASQAFRDIKYFSLFGENNIRSYATYMFAYCQSLICVTELYTALINNMINLFGYCRALKAIPLDFNTSNASRLDYAFYECFEIETLPEFDLSKCTNCIFLFRYCVNLKNIKLNNTYNVTNWQYCFSDCQSLMEAPDIDMAAATNINYMFQNTKRLQKLPNYSMPNLSTMSSFCLASRIEGFEILEGTPNNGVNAFERTFITKFSSLKNLNTSKLTNLSSFFIECNNLKDVEIDVSSVTSMTNIFDRCLSLKRLIVSAIDWAGVSFSINNCSLDYTALLELLGNLPTVTANPTITITNNIGSSQLAAEVAGGTPPVEYTTAVNNGWIIAV